MSHESMGATSKLRILALSLAWSAWVLAAGCAGAGAGSPAAATSAPDAAAGAASEDRAGAPASDREVPEGGGETDPEAEEYEWLTDEQGNRYRVAEIPKYEGHYKWIDEHRVRLQGGLVFEVLSHDEDSFSVKMYAPPEAPAAAPAEAAPSPAPAAAKIPETGEADRLRFESFDEGLPDRGQWRNGFTLADLNGDGHLDIVHGPARKGGRSPVIFLGDGQGSWSLWREARFGRANLDYGDTAVADFDGDGTLDVAFASHLLGLKAFVGDGRGGFRDWSEGLPFQVPGGGKGPAEFSARVVEAVDWNQDGRPDLLSVGEGPRFARAGQEGRPQSYAESSGPVVFLNRGDGSWEKVTEDTEPGERRHYGDSLTVADFDGDGRSDFVVGTAAAGKREVLHLGTSDGGPWEAREVPPLRHGGTTLRAVAAADFDQDGSPDLAVGYLRREGGDWRTGVDVLLTRPGGEWELQPVFVEEGSSGIWALAAGDLDGDGRPDLAAFDGEGDAFLFLGSSDGSFVREESPEVGPPGPGCRSYHAVIQDLDGDGRGELIAGFAGEPGSEVLLGLPESCPTHGALRAWSPGPIRPEGSAD